MKRFVLGILLVAISLSVIGCTDNTITRNVGGTETIDLPQGMTFIEAEWDKDDNLWYTYRPRRTNEAPETYIMQEKSNLGVAQGKIVFVEH